GYSLLRNISEDLTRDLGFGGFNPEEPRDDETLRYRSNSGWKFQIGLGEELIPCKWLTFMVYLSPSFIVPTYINPAFSSQDNMGSKNLDINKEALLLNSSRDEDFDLLHYMLPRTKLLKAFFATGKYKDIEIMVGGNPGFYHCKSETKPYFKNGRINFDNHYFFRFNPEKISQPDSREFLMIFIEFLHKFSDANLEGLQNIGPRNERSKQ
ncbi:MAG: hypothetical protein AABX03_02605, partial [Nanoarchaeota archaeon]